MWHLASTLLLLSYSSQVYIGRRPAGRHFGPSLGTAEVGPATSPLRIGAALSCAREGRITAAESSWFVCTGNRQLAGRRRLRDLEQTNHLELSGGVQRAAPSGLLFFILLVSSSWPLRELLTFCGLTRPPAGNAAVRPNRPERTSGQGRRTCRHC